MEVKLPQKYEPFFVENGSLMTLVLFSAWALPGREAIVYLCDAVNALDYSTLLESHTQKGQEDQ